MVQDEENCENDQIKTLLKYSIITKPRNIRTEYETTNFRFNISVNATIEEKFHHHYHWHYINHIHYVSLIKLGETPWWVNAPWLEEKKEDNVTVEIEINVDPATIKEGKLKLNVTVPVVYLLN